LIDAEAAAYVSGHDCRVVADGPPVLLNPQAYSTMALVIHELVTNSAKYGSLSGSGRVDIAWHRTAAGDLVFDWRETGGPLVKAPTRKGFGSTIINRSVPYDLGGKASIDYNETGVEATFCIPARHVSEPKDHRGPAIKFQRPSIGHPTVPPGRVMKGETVLLVEDSLIIALDAEDILNRLGADAVLTAATVEGALEVIATGSPTIAMLDINLGDRTSFAIADRLLELGIPFLFATGYGEQAKLPPDHLGRSVVQKPYTLENVARVFDGLLEQRQEAGRPVARPNVPSDGAASTASSQ
jgi:CheY-like chemotaxis protein